MTYSSVKRRADEERFIEDQRTVTCKSACIWLIKRLILFIVLSLYTVLGAFLFQALESANELEQCKQRESVYRAMEDNTAEKLWNIGQSYYNNIDDSQLDGSINSVRAVVEQYSTNVIQFNSDGYDGRNCSLMGTDEGIEYDWSLIGSMLFAITVYTTVGYGNIAPETTWGRVCVFAYAMVGIPIMLVCVATIGEVMADVFRFVYIKLCCCGFCARRARRRRRQREAAERRHRQSMQNAPDAQTGPSSWSGIYQQQMASGGTQQPPAVVDDYDDFYEDEDPTVGIPLTVTLLIIFGYIMLGTTLFGVWEKWEPMQAAYFCFVTISTIGFGDVVPGAAAGVLSRGDAFKMVVDGVYILFGLAIISMAFSLIQENMANKVKMLENKLSGSNAEDDPPDSVGAVPAPAVVPMATPYQPPPMPYESGKMPAKAAQPYRPGDKETSFSRPGTSSTGHGARPKSSKAPVDNDRLGSGRSSALPLVND